MYSLTWAGCNIFRRTCRRTPVLQANQEHLNEDHRNHLQHHLQEALIRALQRDLLVEGTIYLPLHLLLPMSLLTQATLG